ncbi:MAG: hypothetical protein WC856_02200 [Methylococcaceae bacterium]|jgi:hypothetical protein
MTDMVIEGVKPCPFCGQIIDETDGDFCYPMDRNKLIWRAGCIESAGGCGAEVFGESWEEAIKKWNTRVEHFNTGKTNEKY